MSNYEKACYIVGRLQAIFLEVQTLNAEKEELEAKIRELESRPVEVAVADNSEEIEKLKEAVKEIETKYYDIVEQKAQSEREYNDAISIIKAEHELKK